MREDYNTWSLTKNLLIGYKMELFYTFEEDKLLDFDFLVDDKALMYNSEGGQDLMIDVTSPDGNRIFVDILIQI